MNVDEGLVSMPPTPRAARRVAVPENFDEFFKLAYRQLITTAMYAGASKDEADEATAATMREVLRRWGDLDDRLVYARRAVISNFIKERTRNLDRVRRRQVERFAGTAEGCADPNMTAWEDEQWVLRMLDSLPPGQRAVMAFVVDGFTPIQISALLGRSPDAIRQSLRGARQRLKAALRREMAEEQAPRPSTNPARKEAR
ncbi:sigma-70 family RNA polymerase sigma factor [Solwaraspora sp. WMMD1047]|uniref:RNA polymerase sigma factor n=1 Tax=Solwaraspora sp. WMMD1047 TaxID=3016102 RepID=UPI002416A488|nr:sigma-70 family RNA polymerase sigma factor [Solwaraspora sp. WMMD1047]MDG4834190.1 sigma-70 family RNA polymerase sigma factor [Solwaraspora sp. WMMD1047]